MARFTVHMMPWYVYQTSFKNLTKFFLLFTRFLLSNSPSVKLFSFDVTWLLFLLVNDLMLDVSGSLAGSGSVALSCTVPAAICLTSGSCVYLLGYGSLVSLVSGVEWYSPCSDV